MAYFIVVGRVHMTAPCRYLPLSMFGTSFSIILAPGLSCTVVRLKVKKISRSRPLIGEVK